MSIDESGESIELKLCELLFGEFLLTRHGAF